MNPLKQTKNEQLDNDFESYLNSDKYKKIKNCAPCFGCDYRCRAKNSHCPKRQPRNWKRFRKQKYK